jgi:hypothetical protein
LRDFIFYATWPRRLQSPVAAQIGSRVFRRLSAGLRNKALKGLTILCAKSIGQSRATRLFPEIPVKLTNLKITPKLGILVGVTLLGLCVAGLLAGI